MTGKQNPDKQKLIEKLNEDLESEFQSIVQYVLHINSIKGPEYQQIIAELREHVTQELDHAMILAQQIDFLGGTPTCRVPQIEATEDSGKALQQDLDLEEKQLRRYRDRIAQAEELGLPDVAEALSPLLSQTQDHVHELRGALAD